jgi:hypothetical protein
VATSNRRIYVALTGGPGGGKSALIKYMAQDPRWAGSFAAVPEAVHYAWHTQISPDEKLFQRIVTVIQRSLEDGLSEALGPEDHRPILCHRGTLDPLGFWLQNGWPYEEFFDLTGTAIQDHYQRYTVVMHLVTSAIDVAREHTRWGEINNREAEENAIQLDALLGKVWEGHPGYYRLDNAGRDWQAKYREACALLETFWPK